MKKAILSAAAAATVAAGAIAVPSAASAQPYRYANDCRSSGNSTAGALIGGIAGAAIGSSLAGDHYNRGNGAALGAVAGALLGSQVAKKNDRCDGYNTSYYNNYRTPYASNYRYVGPSYPTYGRYNAPNYNYGYSAYNSRPYYGW